MQDAETAAAEAGIGDDELSEIFRYAFAVHNMDLPELIRLGTAASRTRPVG